MLSAAWQGADTRRGAATRHVTRKRSSPRSGALPEAERLPPPSSPALAPLLLLGSRARTRSFFFFFLAYLLKKIFFY